ncbi:MAG TPA: hypothetical protein VHD36_12045 [Pirellulales bacterium]|nr:hypothetical protein [Pirellulales bacterium]
MADELRVIRLERSEPDADRQKVSAMIEKSARRGMAEIRSLVDEMRSLGSHDPRRSDKLLRARLLKAELDETLATARDVAREGAGRRDYDEIYDNA